MPKNLVAITEIAKDFLAKNAGYPFSQLENTEFDQETNQWMLTFDVSLGLKRKYRVVIDDLTGEVKSLEPAGV